MGDILIGMGVRDNPQPLFDAARRFAREHTWILLHVVPPEPDFVTYKPGPQHVRDDVAKAIRAEHAHLTGLADALAAEGVAVRPLVVQGEAGAKVLEKASHFGVEAILLGNRRHGVLHDLLLGSVCRAVLRAAPCPVFLIPMVADHPA